MTGSVWYTADTHFGHRNVVNLGSGRPFASVEDHDEALVANWNAVVRPEDEVMHLGDFSLSVTAMERVVHQLNGAITLVAGNHDACWTATPSRSGAKRAPRMVGRYLAAGFAEVWPTGQGLATVAGISVMVSHLPADGDHFTAHRYLDQRPHPGDLPLLCGHVHEAWKAHGRQVNVGVDQWGFTPVHEDELATLLLELPRAEPLAPSSM
jgi:calcineurin-like phosphoesterase family protein